MGSDGQIPELNMFNNKMPPLNELQVIPLLFLHMSTHFVTTQCLTNSLTIGHELKTARSWCLGCHCCGREVKGLSDLDVSSTVLTDSAFWCLHPKKTRAQQRIFSVSILDVQLKVSRAPWLLQRRAQGGWRTPIQLPAYSI